MQEVKTAWVGMCFTILPSFIFNMVWSRLLILNGYMGRLTPSTGCFERVGIRTNVSKTVGMIYWPCRVVGTHSESAYKKWMIVEGLVYQARQRLQVQCPYFGSDLAAGLLVDHHEAQYGVGLISQWNIPPPWDNHRRIGFTFQTRWGRRTAQYMGVRWGRRQGRFSA